MVRRVRWGALGVMVVLMGAACGSDVDAPAATTVVAEPVEEEVAVVDEVEEDPVDEAATDAGPDEGPDVSAEEPATPPDDLTTPGQVTPPIGVVYELTGSVNDRIMLVQAEGRSAFRTQEISYAIAGQEVTLCSVEGGCNTVDRDMLASLGLLGAEVVDDVTMWAASVTWTSATEETIAGRAARCMDSDEDVGLEEYCYDLISGIALRWQVVDEGIATRVVAVEVFEPSEADLAPTGPVGPS